MVDKLRFFVDIFQICVDKCLKAVVILNLLLKNDLHWRYPSRIIIVMSKTLVEYNLDFVKQKVFQNYRKLGYY